MTSRRWRLACALCAVASAQAASAQVTVQFPDYSQRTTASIVLGEQGEEATVSLPTGVGFSVTRIADSTASSAASVAASGISLADPSAQLRISLQADAASFSPPALGAATWSAADVTWNAPSWTGGTGAAGTLASDAFTILGTCTAAVTSCGTGGLVFTLAPNTGVRRSGHHALVVRWKVESIDG